MNRLCAHVCLETVSLWLLWKISQCGFDSVIFSSELTFQTLTLAAACQVVTQFQKAYLALKLV